MNTPDFLSTLEPERYELQAGPLYKFAVPRRAFLKSLGGGLLVVLYLEAALAQESGAIPGNRSAPADAALQHARRCSRAWCN